MTKESLKKGADLQDRIEEIESFLDDMKDGVEAVSFTPKDSERHVNIPQVSSEVDSAILNFVNRMRVELSTESSKLKSEFEAL